MSGFIGHTHMQRCAIGIGVDRHTRNSHLPACTNDSNGDLAAVRDENPAKGHEAILRHAPPATAFPNPEMSLKLDSEPMPLRCCRVLLYSAAELRRPCTQDTCVWVFWCSEDHEPSPALWECGIAAFASSSGPPAAFRA